jgi:single-strand DNA-binding protein
MVSFNRVVLAGNLTRDPELRFTQEGVPVASLAMAVNRVRSKTEAVDFFNVSAWRELGERVANFKKKGDPILIEGRLQYRTWQSPDGTRRSAVDVVADNVQFLNRSGDPQAEAEASGSANKAPQETAAVGGWGVAKQQEAEGNGTNSKEEEDLKEEDFDDIPF